MTTICAARIAQTSNRFCQQLLDPNGPLSRQESFRQFLSSLISVGGATLVPSADTPFKKLVGVSVVFGSTETSAHFLKLYNEEVESIRTLAKQYLKEGRSLQKETLDRLKKMQHQLRSFIVSLRSNQLERLTSVIEDAPFSECPREEALLKKLDASLVMNEKQRNLLDAASHVFSAQEQEMRGLVILSRFFSVEEKGQWNTIRETLQLTGEQRKILDDFRLMLNRGNNKDLIYLLAESYLQSEVCSKTKLFLDQKANAQATVFIAMPLFSLFGIFKNFHFLFNVFHWGSLFTAAAAIGHLAYHHFFSNIPSEIRSHALQLQELNKIEISSNTNYHK